MHYATLSSVLSLLLSKITVVSHHVVLSLLFQNSERYHKNEGRVIKALVDVVQVAASLRAMTLKPCSKMSGNFLTRLFSWTGHGSGYLLVTIVKVVV